MIAADGGYEAICTRVASGETLTQVARSYGVSRDLLRRYLGDKRFPARREAYQEAQRLGAAAVAESTRELADNANELLPASVNKAKLQIEQRKWEAGVRDPETYGPPKQQSVVVLGDLHLDALRKFAGPEHAALPAPVIEGEFEIEDDAPKEVAPTDRSLPLPDATE